MTQTNDTPVAVTRSDAIIFLERAMRNWRLIGRLSSEELEDVRVELERFPARIRIAATDVPQATGVAGHAPRITAEALAAATNPALFCDNKQARHMAASPLTVDEAQRGAVMLAADIISRLYGHPPSALATPQPTETQRIVAWQPIETAPYDTRVLLKVGSMTFPAKLHQGVSMDEDGNDCDQWSAIFEGEHPPCWSGGSCWASNEDEMPSIQPSAWMPFPTSGEHLTGEGEA